MRHVGLIAALLVLTDGGAGAETLMERVKRDGIVIVAKDDTDMAAAMRKARETLPGFLKLARAPQPTMTSFAVKVAVWKAMMPNSSGSRHSSNARTSLRAGSTTHRNWSRR